MNCQQIVFSSHCRKSSDRERLTRISVLHCGVALMRSRPPCSLMMLRTAADEIMQPREILKKREGSSCEDSTSSDWSSTYFDPSDVNIQVTLSSERKYEMSLTETGRILSFRRTMIFWRYSACCWFPASVESSAGPPCPGPPSL